MNRSIFPNTPTRTPVRLAVASAALALLVGQLAPAASAADEGGPQVVIKFLATSGQDPDGTARAKWTDDGAGKSTFSVELEHLDAGSYDLYVTDLVTPKGSITVDAKGEGEIEFVAPPDDPKPFFDFPVFGQQVQVRQADTSFFLDTFTNDGGGVLGDGDKTKADVILVNVNMGTDFDAHGNVKYQASTTKVTFTLEVDKLDAGTYALFVGGEPAGEVVVVDDSPAAFTFQDPIEADTTLLNFDPLGKQVELRLGDVVALMGALPGANADTGVKAPTSPKKAAKDVGKAKGDSLQVALLNTGVIAGAQGSATLTQETDAVLLVTLEGVSPANYDLLVGGISVGTFAVDTTNAAQLEFSSSPGAGQQLLSFAVKGELIEVRSGADDILQTVFPTSVQAALDSFKKETFKDNKVKVNLINGGIDLDTAGTVDWKLKSNGDQDVTIDVRDLPPGDYNVVVNGTQSASKITVSQKGKAKQTWATAPTGSKVALDFDPVDATVQITDSNNQVLLQTMIDVP